MDETTQALLFQQARMGDQSAIHELYTDTRDGAYFAARRYIGGEADVTDILKDTYIIAFGRLGEVPPGKGFTAWLHYVLAIQCLNVLRGRRMALGVKEEYKGFPDEAELFPDAWVEEAPRRGEVLRGVDGLPDGQRLAVTLHYLGGLSVAEMARCMGVGEAAAYTHLQMGKNALRAGSAEAAASGQPALTRLFLAEAALVQMPPEVAKDVYQEMMLFFMDGKKAPKLAVAAASSSGRGGKGKGFLPWLIMFVLVALAIVFLFWNFQRQQKAIGQQRVAEYEMSKAEEAQYQSAASEADPPPPPTESSLEDPAGEESAAPDEDVPPLESQADGEGSGGETVQIID